MSATLPPDIRPKLIGGPLDSVRLAPGERPDFIYVGGNPRRPRVFLAPGTNRFLYRFLETENEGTGSAVAVYITAGYTYKRCDNCEIFHELPAVACGFCGHELVPA